MSGSNQQYDPSRQGPGSRGWQGREGNEGWPSTPSGQQQQGSGEWYRERSTSPGQYGSQVGGAQQLGGDRWEPSAGRHAGTWQASDSYGRDGQGGSPPLHAPGYGGGWQGAEPFPAGWPSPVGRSGYGTSSGGYGQPDPGSSPGGFGGQGYAVGQDPYGGPQAQSTQYGGPTRSPFGQSGFGGPQGQPWQPPQQSQWGQGAQYGYGWQGGHGPQAYGGGAQHSAWHGPASAQGASPMHGSMGLQYGGPGSGAQWGGATRTTGYFGQAGHWADGDYGSSTGSGGVGAMSGGGSFESSPSMGRAQPQRRGPKGWQRSDERIRDELCERLYARDDLDCSEVTVEVRDGRVTLDGSVQERWHKHALEDLADSLPGVRDVENRVRVDRRGSWASDPSEISRDRPATGRNASSGGSYSGSGVGTGTPGSGSPSSGALGSAATRARDKDKD